MIVINQSNVDIKYAGGPRNHSPDAEKEFETKNKKQKNCEKIVNPRLPDFRTSGLDGLKLLAKNHGESIVARIIASL